MQQLYCQWGCHALTGACTSTVSMHVLDTCSTECCRAAAAPEVMTSGAYSKASDIYRCRPPPLGSHGTEQAWHIETWPRRCSPPGHCIAAQQHEWMEHILPRPASACCHMYGSDTGRQGWVPAAPVVLLQQYHIWPLSAVQISPTFLAARSQACVRGMHVLWLLADPSSVPLSPDAWCAALELSCGS